MSGGSLRGVLIDALIPSLPSKFPAASLDYTIDIPCAIDPAQDFLATVSAVAAPSGDGELVLSNLGVTGDSFTVTASGGQPGRDYSIVFSATMTNGRAFVFPFTQKVSAVRTWDQAAQPPSWDFGTPITWSFAPSLDFSDGRNVGMLLFLGQPLTSTVTPV